MLEPRQEHPPELLEEDVEPEEVVEEVPQIIFSNVEPVPLLL